MLNKFNFDVFVRAWERERVRMPLVIARIAENRFKKAFRDGGMDGNTGKFNRWPGRKKKDKGRAILVKSGKLKRGIRAVPGVSFQKIEIKNEVFYGKFHNEGIKGRLPQRRFIGNSKALDIKIKKEIERTINSILK